MSNRISDTRSQNKKIVKNTAFMYFRMFITMIVSIYTSRIILSSLGVVDYGVYNVVGGIVGMLSFLNGALSGATSTYITRSIGENDTSNTIVVYTTAFYLHAILAVIIVVLSEIIGIWFIETQLNIPKERVEAAHIVFQITIITSFFSILNVPNSSLIIANEHMNIYAYISIFEVFMKLFAAYAITYTSFDRLVFYAFLLGICTIGVQVSYIVYNRLNFPTIKISGAMSNIMAKKMASFVSWNLFANVAIMLMLQGTNMVLNVFFGPVVNAARAICTQVQHALTQFYTNVQFAINPQITKCCAQNNIAQMQKYMYASARLSFVVMFSLCLPFLFVCDYVLLLWLKTPPNYASEFIKIGLIINVIDAVSNPFITGCLSTGKIKKLMLICGTLFCMVLPVSYILFKIGCPPYFAYLSQLIISALAFFVRLFIVEELLGINKWDFLRKVALKMFIICIVSYLIVYLANYLYGTDSIPHLVFIITISTLTIGILSYIILLEQYEKTLISNILVKIIKRR